MRDRGGKTANPVGNPKVRPTSPKSQAPRDNTKETFFRDLEKVGNYSAW